MHYTFLLAASLLTATTLLAQTPNNLVLTTPNSTTPGQFNILIGAGAGKTIASANDNVFIGNAAGASTLSGSSNIFIGGQAGNANTTGQGNTMLGYYAGRFSTTANANSYIGSYAGERNTTGAGNTYLGYYAGNANTTGSYNTFAGAVSGLLNTTGSFNTTLGYYAGRQNSIGFANVFIGYYAGERNTEGIRNVLIGESAGEDITTGYHNVMLGSRSGPLSGTIHDAVAIGTNATVALNHAIVLGDWTNTSIAVGIGTDSPQYPLDVRGVINLRNRGTIKFSHLSNPNLRNGATDQFLTVNEGGETVLARYQVKLSSTDQWADKVFEQGYILRPLSEVAGYVRQNKHLPGIPSAQEMVKDGLSLEQLNARLLEKIEELTLYSIQQEKAMQKQQAQLDELKQLVNSLVGQH